MKSLDLIKEYVSLALRENNVHRSFGGGSADESGWMHDERSTLVPKDIKVAIKKWMKQMKLSEAGRG